MLSREPFFCTRGSSIAGKAFARKLLKNVHQPRMPPSPQTTTAAQCFFTRMLTQSSNNFSNSLLRNHSTRIALYRIAVTLLSPKYLPIKKRWHRDSLNIRGFEFARRCKCWNRLEFSFGQHGCGATRPPGRHPAPSHCC